MTVKADTAKLPPWLRYSEDVARQIDAHLSQADREAIKNGTFEFPYEFYNRPQPPTAPESTTTNSPVVADRAGSTTKTAAPAVNGASQKQAKLIDALLVEKMHDYTVGQVVEAKADWRLTRKMIDFLLAAPRKTSQTLVVETLVEVAKPKQERFDFNSVPDGNYAFFEGDPADDLVKFYRVSTNGTWKNLAARASDTLYPIKNTSAKVAIMRRILEVGLDECRTLFVQKLDRCWMCGRHLTNDESRAIGMGPDCASK